MGHVGRKVCTVVHLISAPDKPRKKRKVPIHKPPLTAAAFRFIRLTNAQYVHPGNVIGLKFGKPVLTSAPEKQANLLFCKKG